MVWSWDLGKTSKKEYIINRPYEINIFSKKRREIRH